MRAPAPAKHGRKQQSQRTKQRLLCVLRWDRGYGLFEVRISSATPYDTDIADKFAAITFDGLDFCLVVGSDDFVPVEPETPAVRHRVGNSDVEEPTAFPVSPPPIC